MKPIKLTIDGINSFYDRQEIDFRFDGLFCISGDTGSGKTTILDCIIIALYGNSKRTSSISDYINLRRDKAEIRLVFETEYNGERRQFEVVRYLSRTVNKARLVDLTSGVTVAEQTEKVNGAIMEMIQLSRDDFTQVVILEQGKFAKFLTAGKKERNNTVGNLFKLHRYKELGSKAQGKAGEVKSKLENVKARLFELGEITSEAVENKEKSIMGMKKRISDLKIEVDNLSREVALNEQVKRISDECEKARIQLEKEKEKADKLKAEFEEASAAADACIKTCKELSEQKSALEVTLARSGELRRLIEERDRRNEALIKLRAEWSESNKELESVSKQYNEAVEKEKNLHTYINKTLAELFSIADFGENAEYCDVFDIKAQAVRLVGDLLAAKSEREASDRKFSECEQRHALNEKNHTAMLTRIAEETGKCNLLRSQAEELEKKLERERYEDAAHYIRSGLSEGDICPVCGGVVKGEAVYIGHGDTAAFFSEKKAEWEKVKEALAVLEKNAYSLATLSDESRKALSEARAQKKQAEEKYENVEKRIKLPDKIDNIMPIVDSLCENKLKLNEVQSDVKVLEQKRDASKKRTDDIRSRGESESREKDRLSEVIAASDIGERELSEATARLTELNELREKSERESEMWNERKSDLDRQYAATASAVKLLTEQVENKPSFDPVKYEEAKKALLSATDEREKLIASSAAGEKELEKMRTDLELKSRLESEQKELKATYDIYADIYKLVMGDKFIEYIAEEYILQFTDSASAVLGDITGGKYTLEYRDGDFYVKDFLAGGMERKASTLSGGETFLASLSLAIAISREIARYKTYEFFFLDEGFGTLDAQSLDTVADALVSLSEDTLVGVVTHRSELTDKIFDKITVLAPCGDRGSVIIRS